MSRLPLATAQDLRDELDIVEWQIERMYAAVPVHQERWQNRLDGLLEWRADLEAQLAEMAEVSA
jgi:hypothetical protein